jgi:hypothetical protein
VVLYVRTVCFSSSVSGGVAVAVSKDCFKPLWLASLASSECPSSLHTNQLVVHAAAGRRLTSCLCPVSTDGSDRP